MKDATDKVIRCTWVPCSASYEMVAKADRCGIVLLAAVSAPTSLAVQQAEPSGLTLVGFVQPGPQVVYTCPERLLGDSLP